jgi:hypothetical protein
MMKKKNILLATSVLYYSYLFYQQSAGVNFFVFNIAIIAIVLYLENDIWKQKTWLAVVLGCVLSSACIVYHHTTLAITANLISLCALAGLSYERHTSLVTALPNAVIALLASHIVALTNNLGAIPADATKENINDKRIEKFTKKATRIGIPVVFTLVFAIIYMTANPAFYRLMNKLFSFSSFTISWGWVFFTFGGFMLLFPFFFPHVSSELVGLDLANGDRLLRLRKRVKEATFKMLDLKNEYQVGWLMLAMLNGLLLFVNGLDVYYLWVVQQLPDGIVYADYVHQGVYALIFSIVLAISIILYFFRKNLNFFAQNQKLKNLAYAWILQNAFLVFTTYYKTMTYVNQFGLTHKRIGVFVYLTLTLIGLTTTFIKIYNIRGNWFLFRKNTWAFYAVLLLATCFNWDKIITQHNLQTVNKKEIDLMYLIRELSITNLPELMEYAKKLPDNHQTLDYGQDEWQRNKEPISYNTKELIKQKRVYFQRIYQERQKEGNCWQSWNYDSETVFQAINRTK